MKAGLIKQFLAAIAAHPFLTLVAALLIPAAIQHFGVLLENVDYPGVCEKDYTQDFVMVAALRAGDSPYAPIPELIARYLPACQHVPLNAHPSPHPISMAVLVSPLAGVLSYTQSYALWMAIESLALLCALLLCARIPEQRPSAPTLAFVAIAVLSAFTSYDDIFLGQANFTILALLCVALLLLKQNRDAGAGVVFGIAIGIKFFGWPIAVLLLARKRWKAAAGLGVGFVLVQIVSWSVSGLATLRHYYQEVVPTMTAFYASCGLNQSLSTLPLHLFRGYSEHCYNWPDDGALAVPLFESERLLQITMPFLPLLLAVAIFAWAYRTPKLRDAIVGLTCFSVVLTPVVWGHAAVLSYILLISLYEYRASVIKSPLAILLLALWIGAVFIIPTFVPGSPHRDFLAALHNISVLLAALSSASLALWLPRISIARDEVGK
ncbi:MAG: DUF2029 domain-containing protein [Deltaproteobacteria bacterium]|nr:DUF2029 domain-containing protein [Deltaproteobacteria bacterium]